MGIRVRARAKGFYGNTLREKGEEFVIADRKELGRWMDELGKTDASASVVKTPKLPQSDDWSPLTTDPVRLDPKKG